MLRCCFYLHLHYPGISSIPLTWHFFSHSLQLLSAKFQSSFYLKFHFELVQISQINPFRWKILSFHSKINSIITWNKNPFVTREKKVKKKTKSNKIATKPYMVANPRLVPRTGWSCRAKGCPRAWVVDIFRWSGLMRAIMEVIKTSVRWNCRNWFLGTLCHLRTGGWYERGEGGGGEGGIIMTAITRKGERERALQSIHDCNFVEMVWKARLRAHFWLIATLF